MELTAAAPVLVMVTTTIGIGEYGGGVEGNAAGDGVTPKLAVVAIGVVVGVTLAAMGKSFVSCAVGRFGKD